MKAWNPDCLGYLSGAISTCVALVAPDQKKTCDMFMFSAKPHPNSSPTHPNSSARIFPTPNGSIPRRPGRLKSVSQATKTPPK